MQSCIGEVVKFSLCCDANCCCVRSHDYLTTPPPHLSREACQWECQVNSGEWRSHTTCLEGENERTSNRQYHCVWNLPFVSSKMDCQSILSYSPLRNFGLAELSLPTAVSITSLFRVATVAMSIQAQDDCLPLRASGLLHGNYAFVFSIPFPFQTAMAWALWACDQHVQNRVPSDWTYW